MLASGGRQRGGQGALLPASGWRTCGVFFDPRHGRDARAAAADVRARTAGPALPSAQQE